MLVCAFGSDCPEIDAVSGVPPATDRELCSRCEIHSSRDVGRLPLDYVDLAQLLERRQGHADAKIARPAPASTPPIALHIDALMRDIAWRLEVWEPPVREAAGLSAVPRTAQRHGFVVQQAAATIACRVTVLAGLPPTWGYDAGLDAGPVLRSGLQGLAGLRELHRRSRGLLGLTRRTIRLPGDCSRCGAWALRRDEGTDTVYCDECHQRWTLTEYERYVGLMVTAPETVRRPATVATVRR